MTYTIKLPQFEGPFDLLLFFIERDELDIYNIPIASITDDFLAYIRQMEEMNIDLASEFILVASTLMRIKAKLLLPRRELDEEGNEIDPRQELVDRLIEYKRYKSILDELKKLEEDRSRRETRGNIASELKVLTNKAMVDAELETLTLYRLLRSFERALLKFEEKSREVKHRVVRYNYSLTNQKTFLINLTKRNKRTDFGAIFDLCENRLHAIFTFLALLELLQVQKVGIISGEGTNNFWITAANQE